MKRAFEQGEIPEEDQGPGEPVPSEKKKKAPAKRAKKDDDGDEEKPARKRARKAKVSVGMVNEIIGLCWLIVIHRRTKTTMRRRSQRGSGPRRQRYGSCSYRVKSL